MSSDLTPVQKMVVNSKFKTLTARELFKSIPNAARDWKYKNPMQKWCYFYSIGKIPMNFVRVPLFTENQDDVHWFGYFTFVYFSATIMLSLYTIIYYLWRGDLQSPLSSTCLASQVLGVRKKNKFEFI